MNFLSSTGYTGADLIMAALAGGTFAALLANWAYGHAITGISRAHAILSFDGPPPASVYLEPRAARLARRLERDRVRVQKTLSGQEG